MRQGRVVHALVRAVMNNNKRSRFCGLQLVLSQLPTIHSLRGLNLMCTICTVGFTVTCVAMSIKNGAHVPSTTTLFDFASGFRTQYHLQHRAGMRCQAIQLDCGLGLCH
jgi:hypothetical protein